MVYLAALLVEAYTVVMVVVGYDCMCQYDQYGRENK